MPPLGGVTWLLHILAGARGRVASLAAAIVPEPFRSAYGTLQPCAVSVRPLGALHERSARRSFMLGH